MASEGSDEKSMAGAIIDALPVVNLLASVIAALVQSLQKASGMTRDEALARIAKELVDTEKAVKTAEQREDERLAQDLSASAR